MPANKRITTQINENIKLEAAEVLATLGLTIPDAVRLLLTKIAQEKGLPFEIRQSRDEIILTSEEIDAEFVQPLSLDEARAGLNAIFQELD